MKKKNKTKNPIQPVSGTKVPRFAGPSTFARLPEIRDVKSCDVAIVGVPFDAGTAIDLALDSALKASGKLQDILEQIIIQIMIPNHLKFSRLQMPEILSVTHLILMKPFNK